MSVGHNSAMAEKTFDTNDLPKEAGENTAGTTSVNSKPELSVSPSPGKYRSTKTLHIGHEDISKDSQETPDGKPNILTGLQGTDTPQDSPGEVQIPKDKPKIPPKPSSYVTRVDQPSGILPVCYKTSKGKSNIAQLPNSNVAEKVGQPCDESRADERTPGEIPELPPKQNSTVPKKIPVDQPQHNSTGAVKSPKDKPEVPLKLTSNVPKKIQVDQPHDNSSRVKSPPREKPEIPPKLSSNVHKKIVLDQPQHHVTGIVKSPKGKPEIPPKLGAKGPSKIQQPEHSPVDVEKSKDRPKVPPKPRTKAVREVEQSQINCSGDIRTSHDLSKTVDGRQENDPAKDRVPDIGTPKQTRLVSEGGLPGCDGTPKETPFETDISVRQENTRPMDSDPSIRIPKEATISPPQSVLPNLHGVELAGILPEGTPKDITEFPSETDMSGLELKGSLPGDVGTLKETTKVPSEIDISVPEEVRKSENDESLEKMVKTSAKPTLNGSNVFDPTKFITPGSTKMYQTQQYKEEPWISTGSSLFDEQIVRSQERRQNQLIKSSERAKRLERERLAHKHREEEYQEMLDEEVITKNMKEWISRRMTRLEEEGFHLENKEGELHSAMMPYAEHLIWNEQSGPDGSRQKENELLKKKRTLKEETKSQNLDKESVNSMKQEENSTSIILGEGGENMRRIGENERTYLKTDVIGIYRKKREAKLHKMREFGEWNKKRTGSDIREKENEQGKNLNEEGFRTKQEKEKGETQNITELGELSDTGNLQSIKQIGDSGRKTRIRFKDLEEDRLMEDKCGVSKMRVDLEGKCLDCQEVEETGMLADKEDAEGMEGNQMEVNTQEEKETPHYEMKFPHVTDRSISNASNFQLSGVLVPVAVVLALAGVVVYYELL